MRDTDWNEAVDSYVDGELSPKERREIERRAEVDPVVRDQIEWATTLRERMSSLWTTVPEDYAERLQDALRTCPAWDALAASQGAGRVSVKMSRRAVARERRRRFFPAIVAACSIAAATGLAAAGVASLRSGTTPNKEGTLANAEPVPTRMEPEIASPSTPLIMTPSPEGNPPESVAASAPQSEFWSKASFADAETLEKRTHEFERFCAGLSIRFMKFGGDRKFTLQNVQPEQWRRVDEWLADASVSREASEALRNWGGNKRASSKNVRVTFDAKTPSESEPDAR